MYPGSSRATRTTPAGSGPTGPVPGASPLSEPGRGSTDPAHGKAQKCSSAKGGCEGSPSVPPQPEAFDTSDLRKSIDEVEQQQKRRRAAANEYVEVDLRVNTAKIHVEQQETLLRQTSSNPWFLFNQDVLALTDAKGNKIYSEYGDARARVVSWVGMPVRLRALIGDIGPAPARCLNYVNYLQAQEFNVQTEPQFPKPESDDPRATPPRADEDNNAERMAEHQWFLKLQEAWNEPRPR